jgi:hypothetical protein
VPASIAGVASDHSPDASSPSSVPENVPSLARRGQDRLHRIAVDRSPSRRDVPIIDAPMHARIDGSGARSRASSTGACS